MTNKTTAHKGWIGVDLDGTLAFYDHWQGAQHIGKPIPAMVNRVRDWINDGKDVRIVTARVSHHGDAAGMIQAQYAMVAIMDWCESVFGKVLPVTCTKDFGMIELWDDRAIQVVKNLGEKV